MEGSYRGPGKSETFRPCPLPSEAVDGEHPERKLTGHEVRVRTYRCEKIESDGKISRMRGMNRQCESEY